MEENLSYEQKEETTKENSLAYHNTKEIIYLRSKYEIVDDVMVPKNEKSEKDAYNNAFSNKKDLEKENSNEIKLIYEIFPEENNLLNKKRLIDDQINNNNYNKIYLIEKNECKKKEDKIIFKINKKRKLIYHFDYYIKRFKTNFLQYLKKQLNLLYDNCFNIDKHKNKENIEDKSLFIQFKNMKFHMPNKFEYQGNSKDKNNKEFIKKTIKEVFMDYDNNEDEGVSRQNNNKNLIENIYKIGNFPFKKELDALKDFLDTTIENVIEKYYDSPAFELFKNERDIKFYDRKFYNEKYRNYSMLDKNNGFLKLVKEPSYCHNPK